MPGWSSAAISRQQREELMAIALESGDISAWTWNLSDDTVWGNASFFALFDMPAAEAPVSARSISDRLPPEVAEQQQAVRNAALVQGQNVQNEYRLHSGRWIAWRGRVSTISPLVINGVSFDVTERKQAEPALRESQARLLAAIETVPVGIAVIGADGRLVIGNDGYRRFLPFGIIPSYDPNQVSRWRAWDTQGRPVGPRDFPGARGLRGERVVPGQEMIYTDDEGREIWTSVSTVPTRDTAGNVTGIVTVINDIDALKRSTEVLRESEERQAFLLRLSDTLRMASDADAIAGAALQCVAEHLHVDRAYFARVDKVGDLAEIGPEVRHPELPPMAGVLKLSDFPDAFAQVEADTLVLRDSVSDRSLSDLDRQSFASIGMRALVVASARKGPLNPVWALLVATGTPRSWSAGDVALVEEVAERSWTAIERARIEARLQDAERHARTLVEGVPQLVWRAADEGAWTWASPQWSAFTGQAEQDSHGLGWLQCIHPDDRAAAMAAWSHATETGGFGVEHRLRRHDGEYRWFNMRAMPVRDDNGAIVEWLGTLSDIHSLRQLQERQNVLLAELQHRVRNIMAMIRSVARRTARGAETVVDYAQHLEGRIDAMARTQALLTRAPGAGVDLQNLIRDELDAQSARQEQYSCKGPDVFLSPKAAEVLSLAVHELATNATKYGALNDPDGLIVIDWVKEPRSGGDWLVLTWNELRVSVDGAVRRDGFGTELITQRVPYELNGRGILDLRPTGLHASIEFPLVPGHSILQTDASTGHPLVGRGRP